MQITYATKKKEKIFSESNGMTKVDFPETNYM